MEMSHLTNDLFDLIPDSLERNRHTLERFCGDTFAFVDESEEDVLGADVGMVK